MAGVASVRSVAVFPVKGAAAGVVGEVELDVDGVVGDRRFAVVPAGPKDDRRVLTADAEPRLREVAAALVGGELRLDVPGAAPGLAGAAADAALSDLLGRPVRVVPVPPGSQLDAPVHLVSQQAVAAALAGEHEVAHCACSLEEPRANLVLDLAAAEGPARPREEDLVGRRVAVGNVVLDVHRRPGHCLGVYARVVVPGTVQVNDPVRVIG